MIVSLYGLAIELRLGGDAPASLFDPLWGRFPRTDSPPTLCFELVGRPVLESELAAVRSGVPSFHHGRTGAFWSDGVLRLTDGFSFIDAHARGLSGAVDPRSLADGYSFVHTTLFIGAMWALRAQGLFHLHAGALLAPKRDQGILIVGQGGSGKTTSTLSLIADGFRPLGDDAVLLGRKDGAVVLYALPKPFHLAPRTAALFPDWEIRLSAPFRENHDKRALEPRAAGLSLVEQASTPALILFPELAAETAFEPLSHAEVMGELTRSSALCAVEGATNVRTQLALLAEIASGARGLRLMLGPELLLDRTILPAQVRAQLAEMP